MATMPPTPGNPGLAGGEATPFVPAAIAPLFVIEIAPALVVTEIPLTAPLIAPPEMTVTVPVPMLLMSSASATLEEMPPFPL
jgi:hypothetical protein